MRIASFERPGWAAAGARVPRVGEDVWSVDGPAEVVRVLGRTGDGSRLLELRLEERPSPTYFAAASNVLLKAEPRDAATHPEI